MDEFLRHGLKAIRLMGTPYTHQHFSDIFPEGSEKLKAVPSPDPKGYGSTVEEINRFACDYFSYNFLRKYKDLPVKVDRAKVAMAKEQEVETRLSVTNNLLRSHDSPLFERARQVIRSILGTEPGTDWYQLCGHGPGSTFDLRGEVTTGNKLFDGPISVTRRARALFATVLSTDYLWLDGLLSPLTRINGRVSGSNHFVSGPVVPMEDLFSLQVGNRATTVPKSAFTDRFIAIEPTGNIYLQKGIGAKIRRRLKQVANIDLDDQTHNQELAREGSAWGTYATIDLSSASDSMSYELVKRLLPEKWFELLDTIRCSATLVNGIWRNNEKFSSMGNGFTFELETLVFYALAVASGSPSGLTQVYGDDIIVPTAHAATVIGVLRFCGFETNANKTFVDGPFRESCGKHYIYGVDVTPIYQEENPNETTEERILACNRLYWWVFRMRGIAGPGNDSERRLGVVDRLRLLIEEKVVSPAVVSHDVAAGRIDSFTGGNPHSWVALVRENAPSRIRAGVRQMRILVPKPVEVYDSLGEYWKALSRPCSSAYSPLGITRILRDPFLRGSIEVVDGVPRQTARGSEWTSVRTTRESVRYRLAWIVV